jgi:TRAP-type transport system large permease protein
VDALRGRVPKPRRMDLPRDGLARMLLETVAVLTLPVIIVGGMLAGIYTATEGGGIAVAYAVFLSVVVFRAMTLRGLWLAFLRAARTSASIYLLVAAATILSYALNILGISSWVATAASHFQDSPVLFLFAIAALMLVLGTFLDIGAAILIFAPLIMPVVYELGIDPMQASDGDHADAGHGAAHAAGGSRPLRGDAGGERADAAAHPRACALPSGAAGRHRDPMPGPGHLQPAARPLN